MNNHLHNQHLAALGILGAVLLLPPNLLLRALKRLAILAGVFVAAITVIIGAYAAFTPAIPHPPKPPCISIDPFPKSRVPPMPCD